MIWAGQDSPPGGGFGRFAIKAKTNVVGGTIGLSGVNVELDGNSAEGVLTFATDGRKTLQGTLAADTLDLTPYVSTIRLLTANQHAWNDARIVPDGLVQHRLRSAAVGGESGAGVEATLGRTAIGANLRAGHLTVTVGEAQAYGGVIKGSMALANFDSGVDVKSQLQFTDVDLETCLGQLFGLHRLEGKGNMSFSVEGTGDSVLAVTRTMNGTAGLTGSNGAIAGLNVEQLLRRLERRPLSGGGEFRTGSTPYDKITVALKIAQGHGHGRERENRKLGGTAGARRLGLDSGARIGSQGHRRAGDRQPAGRRAVRTALHRAGLMGRPDHAARRRGLIRRSGAAAPLLRAVRERSARDAVRSAIERLTGSTAAAPTASSANSPACRQPNKPPRRRRSLNKTLIDQYRTAWRPRYGRRRSDLPQRIAARHGSATSIGCRRRRSAPADAAPGRNSRRTCTLSRGFSKIEIMRSCSALAETGLHRNSLTPSLTDSRMRQRSPCADSMMIGMSGTGKAPGERTMRTSSGPLSSGISQSRMTMSGVAVRIISSAAMPSPASMIDLHADVAEQAAHHFARERIVIDHQHAELLDQKVGTLGVDVHRSIQTGRATMSRQWSFCR